ncbi:MAG: hypothetical protein GWP61_12605 [Chloroflexi bacterium]|jgi:hypothetical protein|nr:hypothetical protein [Chloroflexota bacterium]
MPASRPHNANISSRADGYGPDRERGAASKVVSAPGEVAVLDIAVTEEGVVVI